MKVSIFLKGKKDPVVYEGERIDIIDLNLNGIDYKQVRCFNKKGSSKSELIVNNLINKIIES
ncbi:MULTISPECIES: hypothetical protein [Clostridium]|uniref:hypothetical protein n=1 Tax=Clostridium TaxID=1485 RepID=UPI00189A9229|nr:MULTISPECIES: hypothetical protein [Clostridium]MCR1950056.1 hypothetical protein [Clostridium sp. DSM 100503]MDI9215553.1 hypothetical protein [Clostridium tertium]